MLLLLFSFSSSSSETKTDTDATPEMQKEDRDADLLIALLVLLVVGSLIYFAIRVGWPVLKSSLIYAVKWLAMMVLFKVGVFLISQRISNAAWARTLTRWSFTLARWTQWTWPSWLSMGGGTASGLSDLSSEIVGEMIN